jgi:hypothetical protein
MAPLKKREYIFTSLVDLQEETMGILHLQAYFQRGTSSAIGPVIHMLANKVRSHHTTSYPQLLTMMRILAAKKANKGHL